MRDRLTHFRATTLYGAVVLIPLVFGLYVLIVLFGFLKEFLEEVAPVLNTDTYLDTTLLSGLVVIMILGICYLFGLFINTQLGALSFAAVESRVKDLVPGYDIIANLMRGLAGDKLDYPAALISLGAPGTAVLGFVIEEIEDGYFTIFVPSCPLMTVGACPPSAPIGHLG